MLVADALRALAPFSLIAGLPWFQSIQRAIVRSNRRRPGIGTTGRANRKTTVNRRHRSRTTIQGNRKMIDSHRLGNKRPNKFHLTRGANIGQGMIP